MITEYLFLHINGIFLLGIKPLLSLWKS